MALSLLWSLCAWLTPPAPYNTFLVGSAEDVQTVTRPGLVLMGGGGDVDAAFRWMLERSGGGDVVVLRASGADGYNAYLKKLAPVNSVETLVFLDRQAAYEPFVLDRIENAEAIFIAGGDQARYYELWDQTPLAEAVHRASARCPVGGTSAGLAVMGEQAFSARQGTLTSEYVLKYPHSSTVTLETGLFNLEALQGVVTDSHFSQRSRLGRLVAFLARCWERGQPLRGLGVDEGTAVLLDGDQAQVVGKHSAHWVLPTSPPSAFEPLGWPQVGYASYHSGQSFSWKGVQPTASLAVKNGVLQGP